MFKFLELLFPGKARMNKELHELATELVPLSQALIKWDYADLELLSLIQTERNVSTFGSNYTQGIITSIYHEHMAAYKWKKMGGFSDIEICQVKTKSSSFQFVIKGGIPSLYINERFLGSIKERGKIYSSKKQLIASIDYSGTEWWDVQVGDKKIGSIANLNNARDINPRALYLPKDLSATEMEVIFCLACYVIISLTKSEKKLRYR